MRRHFAGCHAVVIAALLLFSPGRIGAGEFEDNTFAKLSLAALVVPSQKAAPSDNSAKNPLLEKWLAVRQRMRHEQRVVELCRIDPASCASDAAIQFMTIVDTARAKNGRARIGEINRAINLAVRPVSDAQRFSRPDVWTSPLATLMEGQGDCEDYALAKLAALWAAGIPEHEARLVIVHDRTTREDHAIAMVRLEGRWLALDNRRFTLVDAEYLTYQPLFALDGETIRALPDGAGWAALDDDERSIRSRGQATSVISAPAVL